MEDRASQGYHFNIKMLCLDSVVVILALTQQSRLLEVSILNIQPLKSLKKSIRHHSLKTKKIQAT